MDNEKRASSRDLARINERIIADALIERHDGFWAYHDLSVFSQEQLDEIAWLLNTRPRKSLGWKAPAELFLPEGTFDFVQYWSS